MNYYLMQQNNGIANIDINIQTLKDMIKVY